ncbi:cold-shock protein [Paenibacillus koleovorans]|uniref:cold-shock protein n=1 Tax=Paenibacillus koleovorans TaxID=121608 RepID=UPI000FDAFFDE|nr:cold-shock protein [Paenibacillus koleovorans]
MYYSKKRPLEEVHEVLTSIWACPAPACKGWMRDNFTFSNAPVCPHCKSVMVKTERMLATLVNTSPNQLKQ